MTFRRVAFVSALLITVLVPQDRAWAASSAGGESARLARALDAYTRPLVAAGHLSGQLLIARHGAIVLERTYGFADYELRVPVTAETRFNVASVTKPMTVVLAIQLMVEKKLAMHDSLAR